MSYIGPEDDGTKFFNELPRHGNRCGQTETGRDVSLNNAR